MIRSSGNLIPEYPSLAVLYIWHGVSATHSCLAASIFPLAERTTLLREHDLVLELRRKTLIRNRKLFALLYQFDHFLVEVWTQLLLQTSELHPEGFFTCTDRWVLQLSYSSQHEVFY
jgi:hypothetical protein